MSSLQRENRRSLAQDDPGEDRYAVLIAAGINSLGLASGIGSDSEQNKKADEFFCAALGITIGRERLAIARTCRAIALAASGNIGEATREVQKVVQDGSPHAMRVEKINLGSGINGILNAVKWSYSDKLANLEDLIASLNAQFGLRINSNLIEDYHGQGKAHKLPEVKDKKQDKRRYTQFALAESGSPAIAESPEKPKAQQPKKEDHADAVSASHGGFRSFGHF